MKRLRRGLLIMMILMSFLAFAACKKNDGNGAKEKDTEVNSQKELDADKEKGPEPTVDVPEVTEDPDKKEDENGTEDEEYIPDFIHNGEPFDYTQYQFFNAGLKVKAPAYQQVSQGIENFHSGMNITIGYYAGRDYHMTENEIETIEDIMDNYSRRLIDGTERYVYGKFEKIEFDSIENITINAIEMVRYEGEMTVEGYEESNRRYVVAYTFIYNGTPNAIFGVVGSAYQEQEFIDELIHNVDESVKTIEPAE